ncbi:MAG: hypothetical protein RMI94_00215 [Bryobacterales bacterium]|nr:hypothetical protein [Bryobacterales bacterium]
MLALLLATWSLHQAVVVTPAKLTGQEQKAIAMLVEEVEKRTAIRWTVSAQWPSAPVPVVVVTPATSLPEFRGRYSGEPPAPPGAEGYRIWTEDPGVAQAVFVVGNDARGVLFGTGRLLRLLRMRKGSIRLEAPLRIATAPAVKLRGHQLGYRPKTNSYDGWTVAMWEQYLRDLAVFGTNAIELIPPRSDDAPDSPHFPLPPMRMMIEMSRLAHEYGLDVWIWYPALDKDYSDPATVEFALKEWGEVFRQLPRIDHVFVPGGDPGHTRPKYLMALLEKQAANLRRYHPRAGIWVSPQGFSQEWLEEFFAILRSEPAWLTGVAAGPQIRIGLAELRARVPKRYPIRDYPDITHSRHCQYPVPDWDAAFALTQGREVINPRPLGHARIFRLARPHTDGFVTYSEGCNDDVNKIVWSALGWDPEADVVAVLREYARYFVGERWEDAFAQGLLALERNWQGPLLTNGGVYTTLEQFRAIEGAATPQELANWRLQMALYRAYYDACLRSRLIRETALEEEAMAVLREATRLGTLEAMAQAEAILDRADRPGPHWAWRARVFELAEALFQSIRMQLSVPRYQAIAVERGANLDSIDAPLNNRPWLKERFAEIRKLASEAERLRAIEEIVNWTNPGPGGFYDDLGNLAAQPRLVRGPGFDEDPDFRRSPLVGFAPRASLRTSWRDHAEALFDGTLRMRYTGLDRSARYRLRVVYGGDAVKRRIRLVADDSYEIHPLIEKPFPFRPLEFEIPAEATADGELWLAWQQEPGLGGNGRGCQVSEVWLLRR